MSDAWRPTEGRYVHPTNIAEGMIVAVDAPGWRQKPWRVHEIRTLDEEAIASLTRSADSYVRNGQRFKNGLKPL